MRWELDPHPFARGGSVAIASVSVMHIVQAALLLHSPFAGDATCMMALLVTLRALGDGHALPAIMVVTAILALIGALFRLGWIRLAVFLPQHALLGIMAVGGLGAAATGSYLDGTPKPWEHITADQLGLVAIFIVHTSAIIRRARDPNG